LDATASTLVFFSLGMFAWGAQNILARGFYAGRDTLTPAWVGTALTFLGLPFYWIFVHRLQHLGLALASSCGITAYTVALFILLTRRTHNPDAGGLLLFFFKMVVASALAAGAAYELAGWLETRIAWQTTHGALLVLVIVSSAGFLLTALFAKLLRVREMDNYWKRLARR
jgi:putative peptidoglycan lipid II flippase